MKTLLSEWRAFLFVLFCIGLCVYISIEQEQRRVEIADKRQEIGEAIQTLEKGRLTLEQCNRVMQIWFNSAQDQSEQVKQCWGAYAKEARKK